MIFLLFFWSRFSSGKEIFTGFLETASAPLGSKCEFPFVFENRTHDDCHFSTRDGLDAPASWCITNSTTGEWGICLPAEYSCIDNDFGEGRICRTSIQEDATFSDARERCSSFDGIIYDPFVSLAAFTDLLEVDISNPASMNLTSFWTSSLSYITQHKASCLADTYFAIFPANNMNSTLINSYEDSEVKAYDHVPFFVNGGTNDTCSEKALYLNPTLGTLFEADISEKLPFYCRYKGRQGSNFELNKYSAKDYQNMTCPKMFTFIPNSPEPCVKIIENANDKGFCTALGGKLLDASTPISVWKRKAFIYQLEIFLGTLNKTLEGFR
ncbi:Oidioi.mRNA.OKI2018_I69.chr2.g5600.t1.cds [Oikopleura dioica]|uniref:Oidioi.mRNA.OKI2018_I69.chr2.g5600.t1.cds n=1 Tax=Oikopleura dioica TaxID=34765 RepID=A0ABN7T9Y9_OIKDI|nr:Oidioi.mRNA.OKI2018_I69.chr2.g5600.t1.cds [Oikopleura dioica]